MWPPETSNCRYVLDWDWRDGHNPRSERVCLISTKKVEKGHEWRAERDYAREQIESVLHPPPCESESSEGDSSEREVVPGGTKTRPKVSKPRVGDDELRCWEAVAVNTDKLVSGNEMFQTSMEESLVDVARQEDIAKLKRSVDDLIGYTLLQNGLVKQLIKLLDERLVPPTSNQESTPEEETIAKVDTA